MDLRDSEKLNLAKPGAESGQVRTVGNFTIAPSEAAMASIEEMEKRLEVAEATLQVMFCAVTALREEGVLTERMIDRIAIDARIRLQKYVTPALTPPMTSEIATQLGSLAERLRSATPSAPLITPPHDGNNGGNGKRLSLC